MFQEYDIILTKRLLDNLPAGTLGTVLIVHEEGKAYEVEFIDAEFYFVQ